MKTIIIYYSLDGNTKFISETIAPVLNADLLELKPVKDLKGKGRFGKLIWGGKQIITKNKPDLEQFDFNPDNFEFIIFGSPVWVGTFAPAFLTFFDKYKITGKKLALFWCHEGGPGKILEKFTQMLQGNSIISYIDFLSPLKKGTEENKKKAIEWAINLTEKREGV